MEIKLEKISKHQRWLNQIAEWRNQTLETLRTCDLTPTYGLHQFDWVDSLKETDKYYFIIDEWGCDSNGNRPLLLGYCGLDKIHIINKTAEISLLINPNELHLKNGGKAVRELLRIAFEQFNLNCVYGECYKTTDVWQFWRKQGFEAEGILKARKFWKGKYYNSVSFSMTKRRWMEING